MKKPFIVGLLLFVLIGKIFAQNKDIKPRVVVLTDAEVDDQCSMVRFLLYANEFNIEGIITTSSQYHSHGFRWAGDDWLEGYLDAYAKVYPNLKRHDRNYPTPSYLRTHSFLGNVESEGEMEKITPGSKHIVKLLLDTSDSRPIWFQAWGGTNTLARALKTIQEKYPDRMKVIAKKMRFFFIWEQDNTYQSYIRPNWGRYNILTIISDQYLPLAYEWKKMIPPDKRKYFSGDWTRSHILEGHGALCALYKANDDGAFRSEGDSPSFLYEIITGLRNGRLNHPGWGSWGGRYTLVRDNTWLDPVPVQNYTYPKGRWYVNTTWGWRYLHEVFPAKKNLMKEYFRPIVRWVDAIQNDFAARADWCVKSYNEANHPPVVKLKNDLYITTKSGQKIRLNAKSTFDPDEDNLHFKWWQYKKAGTYKGVVEVKNSYKIKASVKVPPDAKNGQTIHIICEVTDSGTPHLTRYKRVVITVENEEFKF